MEKPDSDDCPLPHRLADIIRMSSTSLKHFSWSSFFSKEHLPSHTPPQLKKTSQAHTSLQFLANLDLPSIVKISIRPMALDSDRFTEQLNAVRLFFSNIRGPTSAFGVSLTFTWRHWDCHYYDVWNIPEWEPLGDCLSKAGAVARFFDLRGPGCHSSDNELVMENIVVQLTQRLAPLANGNALGICIFWQRSVERGAHTRKTHW